MTRRERERKFLLENVRNALNKGLHVFWDEDRVYSVVEDGDDIYLGYKGGQIGFGPTWSKEPLTLKELRSRFTAYQPTPIAI